MRRALFLFLLVFFGTPASFSGCAPDCAGVEINGRCEEACRDEACVTGYRCVQNACRRACEGPAQCDVDQTCASVTTDHGATGNYCVGGAVADEVRGTEGTPCQTSTDCATLYGYRCIEGSCSLTCEYHGHCGSRGACSGTADDTEGAAVRLCEPDGAPRARGEYGTLCPLGTECAADFTCVGRGPGDADAYCAKPTCSDDAECPTGFRCATRSSSRINCEAACGFEGQPDVEDCVPASEIGPGKTFQCGPLSLLTNVCSRREFCASCETDDDCLSRPNQVCARNGAGSSEKICTVRCQPGGNSCPWGNAGVCGLWDESVGFETCAHRFGSCRGTGQSCEPCVAQEDCPNGFCWTQTFTGERYCVDTTVECSCPEGTRTQCVGGGCPKTPGAGGIAMTCLGGQRYEGSPLFGLCLGAQTDPTQPSRESCWR